MPVGAEVKELDEHQGTEGQHHRLCVPAVGIVRLDEKAQIDDGRPDPAGQATYLLIDPSGGQANASRLAKKTSRSHSISALYQAAFTSEIAPANRSAISLE